MLNKNLTCKKEIKEAFEELIKTEEEQFATNDFTEKKIKDKIKNANKILVGEFPFIGMSDPWTGQTLEDYEYDHTWIDDLEPGWKKTFGLDFCVELKESLIKDNFIEEFQFLQIKEKFGGLRLYSNGYGENSKNIIAKYEELSYYICGRCGKPATKVSQGWIYPFCDECSKLINSKTVNIEDYYNMLEPTVSKMIDRIIYHFTYNDFWKTV